jgi:thioredoxin 2
MDELHPTNVVPCVRCGRKNRVPAIAEGTPTCGHCHARLPWIAEASDETFASVVETSKIPVVVDLWAEWCAPCRMLRPGLEQLARVFAGRMKLVSVDVDRAPRIAERFSVRAVPMLMVMKGSEVIATHAGAAPVATLAAWVEDAIAKTSSPAK